MPDKNVKIYHAGKAPRRELEEIDNCRLCELLPELEKVCRAVEYCHRQLKMDFSGRDEDG